jgi:hypothetical protein
MTTLAVQFYDVVVWLHVSAVVVGLGATFAYGIFISVAGRVAPRSMPGVFAGVIATDRALVVPGVLVILATGLYLTIDRWEFSDFFVSWGLAAIVILIVLGIAVFSPNEEKARAAAEEDVERAAGGEVRFGPEFERTNRLLARVGVATGLLVILTVYVMTAKPFL